MTRQTETLEQLLRGEQGPSATLKLVVPKTFGLIGEGPLHFLGYRADFKAAVFSLTAPKEPADMCGLTEARHAVLLEGDRLQVLEPTDGTSGHTVFFRRKETACAQQA